MGKKFDRFAERHILVFIPKWVHPNLLSVAQVLFLVPVFCWYDTRPWLAAIIFSCGKIFDLLDGPLARLRGQKSELGAFLDSTSDKVFVIGTLLVACGDRVWLGFRIAVIFLDVVLIVMRPIKRWLGATASANSWGKIKTWVQSFALAFVLTRNPWLTLIAPLVFIAAVGFAAMSLAGHIRDIRSPRDIKA